MRTLLLSSRTALRGCQAQWPAPTHLTLAQAQQLAIQNNPQFTAARYNAAAAYQVAPQYKSAYAPDGDRQFHRASAPTMAAASPPAD